jgi:hypothetical protein
MRDEVVPRGRSKGANLRLPLMDGNYRKPYWNLITDPSFRVTAYT